MLDLCGCLTEMLKITHDNAFADQNNDISGGFFNSVQ